MRIMLSSILLTTLSTGGLFSCEASGAQPASSRDYGIVKNQSSPFAKLGSVDLASVRWTDGFWADRFDRACRVTLPRLWELAADPQAGHALSNLKIAAGLEEGEHAGTNWQDAWVYKWLESACYVYRATDDEKLDRHMDEVIGIIAKAQQPDGYIATQITVRGWDRFQQAGHHELYTMGHLITAACAHHRITGKTSFLDIATRTADCIYETFKGRDPRLADFPINPSIIMAGVELYRTTGEKKYLDMANFFIDWRGSRYGTGRRNAWIMPVTNGSDLNQNWRPLRKEIEVVGHAVFYTYLFAGAADAYMETGDKTLLAALERLWLDLVQKKTYITGGVSPKHKAHPVRTFSPGTLTIIGGDSIHEGVGAPFDLPNDTAYNETCGQIGNLMSNWRMLSVTGQARFADVMEQSLYNSILSGVNLSGKGWSYTNPLRWNGPDHVLLSQDSHQRFDPGIKHICCPTNLLRTVLSWHGYLYSTSDEGLCTHHYGGSVFDGRLADGRKLKVTQETDFPWDDDVRLTLDTVESDEPFSIALRIPGWARGASLSVNGQPTETPTEPGSYAVLKRPWQSGDVIELSLPMPVKMMVADQRIEQTRGQVAVMRGPIVYCLESTDLPEGVRFEDVHLPRDAKWTVHHDPELLDGVTVLRTKAAVIAGHDGTGGLYRELEPAEPRYVDVQLIPYYAWNNRGEPKMTVWIPLL